MIILIQQLMLSKIRFNAALRSFQRRTVSNNIQRKFLLIFVILFSLCNPDLAAQIIQGCQATATSGSNSIYYVADGYNGSVPQFRNDNFSNRYQVSNIYCYSGLGAGHGSCYIQGYGGPSSDYGTLVTFSTNPQDCPLDSNLIGVFGLIAILGMWRIRRAA